MPRFCVFAGSAARGSGSLAFLYRKTPGTARREELLARLHAPHQPGGSLAHCCACLYCRRAGVGSALLTAGASYERSSGAVAARRLAHLGATHALRSFWRLVNASGR